MMGQATDFLDEYLAKMWDEIYWKEAEEILSILQRRLCYAAKKQDTKEIFETQKKIVRNPDIKCLAVRKVCSTKASPGVDGVVWRTSAEKMRAALSLTSKNYHASPLREIIIESHNTGKKRRQGIPTYYDRAMQVLYGYSLIPVTETLADRASFAFRPGRSTQDAHTYVLDAIKGMDAPEYMVCADVKGCYAHIQHSWLMRNVPMDRHVLKEFLNAGIVFAGELFPSDGTGISEGANLSPYLGNFTLDGLQKYIYERLYGTDRPKDFSDGHMIRYADDVLVTVRSEETGRKVLEIISDFLEERGLFISPEKTHLCKITDGFTFLSRTYIRRNDVVYTCPSDEAVNRFIDDICTTISTYKKSQRHLIQLLNQKLKGWANYHRYSDAEAAFRNVDVAVQTALLDAATKKHPHMPIKKLIDKYWYEDAFGRHFYSLEDDRSVRVIKLVDTVLAVHPKMILAANPYIHTDYLEERTHNRDIQNVAGKYRAIWERQDGKCHYCGRPILADQERTTVILDPSRPSSIKNSAYIHKICEANDFQIVRTMEDTSLLRIYDTCTILEGLSIYDPEDSGKRAPITPSWRHYKLKEFFSQHIEASITLTFQEIEKIEKRPLSSSARKDRHYWYRRKNENGIAEAWRTEGYSMKKLDLEKEKATFHRDAIGASKLIIPSVLLNGKLPDNAVYELWSAIWNTS